MKVLLVDVGVMAKLLTYDYRVAMIGLLGNLGDVNRDQLQQHLRDWYNGYLFHEKGEARFPQTGSVRRFAPGS